MCVIHGGLRVSVVRPQHKITVNGDQVKIGSMLQRATLVLAGPHLRVYGLACAGSCRPLPRAAAVGWGTFFMLIGPAFVGTTSGLWARDKTRNRPPSVDQ
jgi:hypothetical protein